ncbi:GntR family transcriptional regulator, partial [Streptomyces sp. SP18CS02]|nr:GntR family transcriptional regulator [Streptomyces sp. SP18CS02]
GEVPRPARARLELGNLVGLSVGVLISVRVRTLDEPAGRPVVRAAITVAVVRWEFAYEIGVKHD